VENAIKFNNNRGGYVLLTSYMTFLQHGDKDVPSRYRLSISCADTGPGISDVSRLFLPFSQADSSMQREYGGTGLGLAITKRLVELLNGDAWCDSVVGQGSTFYFTMVRGLAAQFNR
jgi:signal transduction histidine kinase